MKVLKITSLLFVMITFFFSCEKEDDKPPAAIGTLGVNAGDCTPFTLSGIYKQGVALTSANTVTVEVNVTTPGIYTISTNTVNGVSFSQTGTFAHTGKNAITLTGTGTPITFGSQNFTVTFGNSTCSFLVNFEQPPATGTLGGAPDLCTPVTIFNNTFDAVTIQVNVASPGPYRIKTDTRNGVTFVDEGVFTSTGLQNVRLSRNGSPVRTSTETFTITFGSSSCNFTITLIAFGPENLFNYFPTTAGSFWSYLAQTGKDSFTVTSTAETTIIDGKVYNVFTRRSGNSSTTTSSLYRRSGGEYFENLNIPNGVPANVDLKFLDETAPVGVRWKAATYLRTLNGVTDTVTIEAVIHSKKFSETLLNGLTFNDVIVVGYFYYSRRANEPFPFLFQRDEKAFARKVGLIRSGTELEYYLRRVRVE